MPKVVHHHRHMVIAVLFLIALTTLIWACAKEDGTIPFPAVPLSYDSAPIPTSDPAAGGTVLKVQQDEGDTPERIALRIRADAQEGLVFKRGQYVSGETTIPFIFPQDRVEGGGWIEDKAEVTIQVDKSSVVGDVVEVVVYPCRLGQEGYECPGWVSTKLEVDLTSPTEPVQVMEPETKEPEIQMPGSRCDPGCLLDGVCDASCIGEPGCEPNSIGEIEIGSERIGAMEICDDQQPGAVVNLDPTICDEDLFLQKVFCTTCTNPKPIIETCYRRCEGNSCDGDRRFIPECGFDAGVDCTSFSARTEQIDIELQNKGSGLITITEIDVSEAGCDFTGQASVMGNNFITLTLENCDAVRAPNGFESDIVLKYTDETGQEQRTNGHIKVKVR
ncbi:MAG: hypothetical protein ABIC95_02040 [archaeon]